MEAKDGEIAGLRGQVDVPSQVENRTVELEESDQRIRGLEALVPPLKRGE